MFTDFKIYFQILCLAESVTFTEKCEQAFSSGTLHKLKSELEVQLESYTSVDISGDTSKDSGAHVLELKLKALILDTIHFIDIVNQLQQENVKSSTDWVWQKQLRFYMDNKGKKIKVSFVGFTLTNMC